MLVLLPQTTYVNNGTNAPYDVVGDKSQAAGYYISGKTLQTVFFKFSNVTATVSIEATLSDNPTESDWFTVHSFTANAVTLTNSTLSSYANIEGNFMYVRAKLTNFMSGIVDFIRINY